MSKEFQQPSFEAEKKEAFPVAVIKKKIQLRCVNSHRILLSPLIYVKANLVSHHQCFSFILMLRIYFLCKIVHFYQPRTLKKITFFAPEFLLSQGVIKLKICRQNFGFLPQETQKSAQSRQQWISTETTDRFLSVRMIKKNTGGL